MSPARPARGNAVIALVNPNTNRATTTMMAGLARESMSAVPPAGILEVTVDRGPAMIVEPRALTRAAAAVVQCVRSLQSGSFDAVIVAAVGDPGREALESTLDVPVVGIGQAAILRAAALGKRFAMATTTPELVASLGSLVEDYGAAGNFAGVFLTRDGPIVLAADPQLQYVQLREAAQAAVEAGAETVIIAGGPLGGTARRIRESSGMTVIEPVPAAVRLVQQRLTGGPAGRGDRGQDPVPEVPSDPSAF